LQDGSGVTQSSASVKDCLQLRLHRDHLYMAAAVYEARLAPAASVALIREDDDLLIFPIANVEAGGFYIKQVNARGDRAIHAADFFRLHAIHETLDIDIEAFPHASAAGFIVRNLFADAHTKFAMRK
jgi:hypothetical protein